MSDYYVSTYDICLSGVQLDNNYKQYITNITINETSKGADTATLNVADPALVFVNENIFAEENTIQIDMGIDISEVKTHFDGYISAVDVNFGQDGVPRITITCMDKTHVMNREKKNATFKKKTSAQIVQEIVKKYGFKCVVDSTYKYEKKDTINQSSQTDAEFIQSLAGRETVEFTAKLVGDTFYYMKSSVLSTPKVSLMYGSAPNDSISFNTRVNKENIKKAHSSGKVDGSTKKASYYRVSDFSDSQAKSSATEMSNIASNLYQAMQNSGYAGKYSEAFTDISRVNSKG